jgi:hypothetical protein
MAISGFIRSPDEEDPLSVKLSLSSTEITLCSDGVELGKWPSPDVDIRLIDSTSFEFIAEGDRLIFMPDDPAAFGDSPLVDRSAAPTRRRRGRKSKKTPDGTDSGSAKNQTTPESERRPERRTSVQESSKAKPSKPSRRDRRAAAKAARAEAVPAPPSIDPGSTTATSNGERPAADEEPSHARRRTESRGDHVVPGPEIDENPRKGAKERLNRAWLRSLDTARRYDLLGLDRVPIDEAMRGQEHQHTWDHRVAVASGAGNRICTICGKIRR